MKLNKPIIKFDFYSDFKNRALEKRKNIKPN